MSFWELITPGTLFSRFGRGVPRGRLNVKFWNIPDTKRNREFRANVSPAHKRLPENKI